MSSALTNKEPDILKAVKYQPGVSIIMPFEPKMSLKAELEHKLKLACQQVEKELRATYPDEQADPVLDKLRTLIKNLNFSTYKKSIALFVSPLVEKVYYLDIPVEEKIIIDESFEIRDLIFSKKELHKYLVLVISGHRSRIFLGNTTSFVALATKRPQHIATYIRDAHERVGNFSDPAEYKEVLLEKFLRHIDTGLGIILRAYSLPLFVMGTHRTMGHFKKITRHLKNIAGYVHGNFDEANETAIRYAIAPLVADWKKVKQENLMSHVYAARGAGKLATGIHNVWHQAACGKGRLLVVERNYMVAARYGAGESDLQEQTFPVSGNALYIKDAVDDVIEKVLNNGGDVEFVEEGLLGSYGHIALIEYY